MHTTKASKHIHHYLPLVSIFLAGIGGFLMFSYDKWLQIGVVVAIACSYVAWGIIHHYLHHDLHISTIAEYVLIAVLGLFTIITVIIRT